MKELKNILRLSITLLLITAVIAGALAGVNAITKDPIATIKAGKVQNAITAVLPNATGNTPLELTGDSGIVTAVYQTNAGYAVQVSPSGFGGNIDMMVGVGADGKVTGISIISHAETAGLGAIAAANSSKGEEFRNQFVGQGGDLAVKKDGGSIDAISSSTITSRAVTEGVNAAVSYVLNLGKEAA